MRCGFFIAVITVSLISLGCAKNLVDSEIMTGHLLKAGMSVIPDAATADVVIVNTCSFLQSSKEESINAILEARRNRGAGGRRGGQKLIVAGCLAQRYRKELPGALPEADAFIGLDQITQIAPIIGELFARDGRRAGGAPPRTAAAPGRSFVTSRPCYIPDSDTPRFLLTPRHYAHIKIAEGCDHPCTFCAIPQIRGRHRSRSVASIVAEARQLVAAGARELNLISQDTTYYGMDAPGRRADSRPAAGAARGPALTTLLRELQAIPGDFWIRLLYTHPAHWSDELIRTIAACDKIARYADMPLQHISDRMLAAMRRQTTSAYIRDLVRRIRAGVPGIALRTAFIVGFPGETEADVDELCDFLRETKFERLGVFRYSREEGTRAAKMPGQVSARRKDARWHRVMSLQKEIAREAGTRCAGRVLRVLVEAPGVARGEADAPDVDCRVHVPRDLPAGAFASVEITGSRGYDLLALPAPEGPSRPAARPKHASLRRAGT